MTTQQNEGAVEKSYIFNRDFNSSVRLNYLHWLWKEITGYLLHPKVHFNPETVRIADVGTGTAIWLLELSDTLPPSARLDGFDISSAQYPPRAWVPENVHLHVQDSFTPFPAEHRGQYDVVNLRSALCYVNKEDAEPLLRNMISLLKPGGYLQWFEPDACAAQCKAFGPATSTAAVEKLARMWHKPKPDSTYDWVRSRFSLYEKNGLKVVENQEIAMKDIHRLPWAHGGNLLGFQDFTRGYAPVGAEKKEEFERFVGEFEQGLSIDNSFICAVGQKAM